MKAFVTGATGFIGTRLVQRLVREGHEVNVLVRNPGDSKNFDSAGISVSFGDIFSVEKLKAGMEGCNWVFHLAAFVQPYSKEPGIPYKTNVEGTKNLLKAARESGITKVIVTSTAGTMGYSRNGNAVDELTNIDPEYHTDYEKTKSICEKISAEMSHNGMDVIIVNPSRVFGPGKLSKSNSVTKIMRLYGKGIWRIIPGDGTAIGNYAFIDDVVNGHLLAATKGKPGHRYILGGENISFDEFFKTLGKAFGTDRKMIRVNASSLRKIASFTGFFLDIAGKPPIITSNWIDKYLQNWSLSCNKAISELNYSITPFGKATEETVKWLKSGKING